MVYNMTLFLSCYRPYWC